MTLPTFSPWLHWDRRASLECRYSPGVYLLARFEEPPADTVDPVDQRILLVGETHDQTFQKRWDQFQYSAFKGGSGHAGGRTFYQLFCNGTDATPPPWLYVSAASVLPETSDIKAYVQFVKNQLLSQHQDSYGLLPCCNVRGPVENSGAATQVDNASTMGSPIVPPTPGPIDEPSVTFSRWCRWEERESLEGMAVAGVYALACFDGEPPSVVDVLDERSVYFGETCDNSLAGRLWQFNRSAFLGKYGHSGGWSFSVRCAGQKQHLYVSICPIASIHEPHRSAFIRHTERKLLWQYVLKWGRRPVCNSK